MFVISGATGHVGSAAAKELLAKKQPVKVVVRDAAKAEALTKRGAQAAVGSLDDSAFLASALKGAAGFFAMIPPNYAAPDLYAAQTKTADSIAAAVKASGVPHVVMLSSVGADLPSGTGPIRGLHYLENALRETGAILTAIRACYFQENVANVLAPARQAGIFPNMTASADYAFPMIATKDIGALAAASLLNKPAKSEVVDLEGPSYSNRQAARLLGQALGKELKVVDVPAAGRVQAMMQGGLPEHLAKVFAEMYEGFEKGLIKPKGDRMARGQTELAETVAAVAGAKTA
ncbi:MAG TPA: NmrA family NAD(P)-binding protein [Elusimicrobiota bacterium]|nr:NmrA family NAD(P)-binding protein [Elusimicrobiota bacterium]